VKSHYFGTDQVFYFKRRSWRTYSFFSASSWVTF
jgi:hypothetical protein